MGSNAEKRITAKMVLDSTGYNSSIKGINAEMKNYQAQMKVASEGIKQFGKDTEKLKSVQESLTKQVELHSKKIDTYKQAMEKATSKMQENIKERDKLKNSLESANRKYEEAVRLYGKESEEAKKAKEEVESLEKEYKNKEKAVESNAKQVQNYERNMNSANTAMIRAQGELRRVNEELARSNNKWLNASENLKKTSEKLKNVGGGMEKVGEGILKFTAPVAAFGVVGVKSAIDFESAFAGVKKTVDATEKQLKDLEIGIRNMSKEMPQSAVEIAGVAEAAGQLGIKTENILGFTKSMVMLGDSTNMSSEQAATSLARLANITQMPQTEFDKLGSVIVHLGNNLATTESEIVEMGLRLAGAGKQIGLTEAQTLGLAGALSSVGIEAEMGGSAISKIMVKMQAAATIGSEKAKQLTEATGMSIRELELLASNNSKAFKEVADSLNMTTGEMNAIIKSSKELENFGKIAGMTGEQFKEAFEKDATTAIIAFIRGLGNAENAGTSAIEMLEEMGIKEVRLRDSLLRAANAGTLLEDSINMGTKAWGENVALVNEASQRYETTESKIKMAKNQIVDAGMKIGVVLLPHLVKLVESVANIAEGFSNLNPKTQETIVKAGALAIGLGGVLKVTGGLVSGIGSAVGAIGNFAKWIGTAQVATTGIGTAASVAGGAGGIGALATGLGGAVVAAAPFIAGAAAIGAAAYGVHKVMSQDAVPSVDLFANKVEYSTKMVADSSGRLRQEAEKTTITISETTKKSVEAYLKLDEGATKSLTNLYVNGTKITNENKNQLISAYSEMSTQIKDGMDKHYNEEVENMKQFFSNSKNITTEEQQKILQGLQEHNNKQKQEIDGYEKRIKEIMDKASKENRELKKEEQEEINKIQDKMKTNAVKSLSDSEVESKVILERLKGYSTRITTEQASEVIKNAEKQRLESVGNAEKQYDETVRNIIKLRDESKKITADQANKMIKEAERQRDETIKKADEQKQGIVNKIKDQNEEVLKNIDEGDGEIMSKWDKLKNWFADNPITRFIKTITSGGDEEVGRNWTGTNYWKGGLTYLHDAPGRNNNYELYDLPRGTRIFNHDASEDMVRQTAEQVATKVANSVLSSFNGNGGINVTQNIYSPTPSPSEVARQTKNSLRELALNF